tara:strand:+ start:1705 stop:2004 length:300 start_codon:yes stop_codon:yes gene_type:complete
MFSIKSIKELYAISSKLDDMGLLKEANSLDSIVKRAINTEFIILEGNESSDELTSMAVDRPEELSSVLKNLIQKIAESESSLEESIIKAEKIYSTLFSE